MHMWSHFLLSSECPALLSLAFLLLQTLFFFGVSAYTLWLAVAMLGTKALFILVNRLKGRRDRIFAIFALCELVQTLISTVASFKTQEIVPYLMFSTLLLGYTEVTPLFPAWVNLTLVGKHWAMWTWVTMQNSTEYFRFSQHLFPLLWSLFHTSLYLRARKQLAEKSSNIATRSDEQAKLVSLVLAIPDGVVVITEDRRIAAYNHMFVEQMGVSPGISYDELYKCVAALSYDPNFVKDIGASLEEDILDFIRSGATNAILNFKPVLVNGRHLEWRGKVGWWDGKQVCISTVRDSTQWVKLEEKAKNESKQKSALLRSVSHELRTPTNAIINQALALHEAASGQVKTDLEMIVNSTKLLMSMIGDLLDFSQISDNALRLTKTLFSLRPTIDECIQLIKPQCIAKGLYFRLLYDELLPEEVTTDQERLKQVILHLLSNAVK